MMVSFEDFEEMKRGMWVPRCLEIVVKGCENSFVVFAGKCSYCSHVVFRVGVNLILFVWVE